MSRKALRILRREDWNEPSNERFEIRVSYAEKTSRCHGCDRFGTGLGDRRYYSSLFFGQYGVAGCATGTACGGFGARDRVDRFGSRNTRVLRTFLFEVEPLDVTTFKVVSAFLGCVALLANYIPERWAAKIDPMVALRYE